MGQISVTWFNKMHRGHKVSSVTVLPEMHNLNVIMKNFRQTQTVGQSLKYLTCLPHTCQELGLDWILVLHKTKKKTILAKLEWVGRFDDGNESTLVS